MLKKRLIAVLILANNYVVQSIKFKHTNVIHYDPVHAIDCFNKWAVDEIIILNVSRTQDTRESFLNTVSRISQQCFVPLSVGGWVTDIDYAQALLKNGADKIVVNTIIHTQPSLVIRLSEKFGKQCIVASIDVKKNESGLKEVIVDRGRHSTGADVVSWAQRAETLGVGEILLNSVDHDGARKGYDLETLDKVCRTVSVPVIAFGGVFTWSHLAEGLVTGADAVAAANIFHYTEFSTKRAKKFLFDANFPVRGGF